MWSYGRKSNVSQLLNQLNTNNQIKVLVPTREHISRLKAARMQADLMGSDLIIVARTDALSAKLIDNNSDPLDQPFIEGVCADAGDKLVTFVQAGELVIQKIFSGNKKQQVTTKENFFLNF